MRFPSLFALSTLALPVVTGALAGGCSSERLPAPLDAPEAYARFETRPSNTTCLAGDLPLGRVKLVPRYDGFTNPVRMIERRDLGLVFVAEMQGRIKTIDTKTGVRATALDLVGKVGIPGQPDYAMYGVAFHPTRPEIYVTVDRLSDATTKKDLPFRTELVRFTSKDGGRTFDPASEKVLLRFDRSTAMHSANTVEFGPDGYLYVSVGDGARNVPTWPSDELLGAVVRIDVDNGDPYAIPADNPYAKGGGRPEIYAGGLRNPWRFTFDRVTGKLWLGDVGQDDYEEIDVIELGKNYGWPVVEGNACRKPGCDKTGFTAPVLAYPHSEGGSITGGYVYRGKALPELVGKYVFADFTVGHIRVLEGEGDGARYTFLNPGGPKPLIASFGEDADGELYALGWDDGTIYQLVPGDPDPRPVFPALLSDTGCVDKADPKKMAPGLVPYGVNVELWSDGAEKRRWLAIPDGKQITVAENGHLDLPPGSVVVKEFFFGDRRVETRFLRLHTGGEWTATTYEWNDAQTDATLVETARERTLPNGQVWAFPSQIQCFVCHKKAAGRSLGLETLQLNGDFQYRERQRENQLEVLAKAGILDKKVDIKATKRLPALFGTAPVEDRARAYLHANCAFCHRPDGGTGAVMDLRFGEPLSAVKGCTPSGFPDRTEVQIVKPGDPDRSTLYLRPSSRIYPMPPLGVKKVDTEAMGVLAEWIRGAKTCE